MLYSDQTLTTAQNHDDSYITFQRAPEALLIPKSEVEVLQSFDGRGQITLSAYLRTDTPQFQKTVYDSFIRETQASLDECGSKPECREALQEDMEIVGLYLKTNGHRRHAGIAIFSCAAELFWRAYPLPVPIPTRVSVGPRFDLEPLLQAIGQRQPA